MAGRVGLSKLTVLRVEDHAQSPHGSVRYHWGGLEAIRDALETHHASHWDWALEVGAGHAKNLPTARLRLEVMAEAVLSGPTALERDEHLRLLGDFEARRLAHGIPLWHQSVSEHLTRAVSGVFGPEQAADLGWLWTGLLVHWLRTEGARPSLDVLRRALVDMGTGMLDENA